MIVNHQQQQPQQSQQNIAGRGQGRGCRHAYCAFADTFSWVRVTNPVSPTLPPVDPPVHAAPPVHACAIENAILLHQQQI